MFATEEQWVIRLKKLNAQKIESISATKIRKNLRSLGKLKKIKKNEKKIEIFITLGPSTLNKIFLKKIKKSVNLLRLNLSHVELKNLASTIKFIKIL